MCDFEDMDIIARYTRKQAVDDGVLVEVLRWKGRPVMATSHIADEISINEAIEELAYPSLDSGSIVGYGRCWWLNEDVPSL